MTEMINGHDAGTEDVPASEGTPHALTRVQPKLASPMTIPFFPLLAPPSQSV